MRFAHTNLIARDVERLVTFYCNVFGCRPVPPARELEGDWLAQATGVQGAVLRGLHLRVPGHGEGGPTLEIFGYRDLLERPVPAPNRQGLGHLAFEVDDVAVALAEVLANGGQRLGDIVERRIDGVGMITFTYARDPEGNIIELQHWDRDEVPPGHKPPVREMYERWASRYDGDRNITRDLDAAVLPTLLPDISTMDVLELGCGTGKNTAALVAARSVTAVDFSPAMLELATAKVAAVGATNVRFVEHDIHNPLPFDDASFDLGTIDLVLEHLPAVEPVLGELFRVLRPGGTAFVLELHPTRQRLGKRARFEQNGVTVELPAYVHPMSEHVGAAIAAGFRIVDLGEWSIGDDSMPVSTPAEPGVLPRLLSLRLER